MPNPPPPPEVQSVEEVWTTIGPNLAPNAPEFFRFGIRWGVTTDLTLRVDAQNAQNFMGNVNMYAK